MEEDMDVVPVGSSGDEGDGQARKIRRVQRACDMCRKKKIRCDGVQLQSTGTTCSNCVIYKVPCTYIEAAKVEYIEGLENRVEKLEQLIQEVRKDGSFHSPIELKLALKLMPDEDLVQELGSFSADKDTWRITADKPDSVFPRPKLSHLSQSSSEEDRLENAVLFPDNLDAAGEDPEYRFHGKSSTSMLLQTAWNLKQECTSNRQWIGHRRPLYWHGCNREDQFMRPYSSKVVEYSFPPDDLLNNLVDLYFDNVNYLVPLLHRPTLDRHITSGLHHRDEFFARVLLLVCANGSKFSEDQRVLLDEDYPEYNPELTSGWKWFKQVETIRKELSRPPTLFDLQIHVLYTQFLLSCSAVQAGWSIVGMGVRYAQDLGLHRKRLGKLTPEYELLKRAFWALFVMEQYMSSMCGRTPILNDQEYDVELPVECDDEYWEHPDPELCFKQPPGKPSTVTYFNHLVKLHGLFAKAVRTIFVIRGPPGVDGQRIITELDASLNCWVDDIPAHLKWDPHRENGVFFDQSATTYLMYYHTQIIIHRSVIPSFKKSSPLSFPSLAVCANAARSSIHIVEAHRQRGRVLTPYLVNQVFVAGLILLMTIWGGKRSGLSSDPNKEMKDVHKGMEYIQTLEKKWYIAGKCWDYLYELASIGDLPLPKQDPPAVKREREEKRLRSSSGSAGGVKRAASFKTSASTSLSRASSSSASSPSSMPQSSSSASSSIAPTPLPQQPLQLSSLPVHGEDLGRLPVHGQLDCTTVPVPSVSLNSATNPVVGDAQTSEPACRQRYWFTELASADRDVAMQQPESRNLNLDLDDYSGLHLNVSDAHLLGQLDSMSWGDDKR